MPRTPRVFFALLALLLSIPSLARAHAPLESSLEIRRTEENLEASAVLTFATARLLLPIDKRESLTPETFASHGDALRAAASSVCTLLDASAAPLPPVRTLVSLYEGEIHFLILYPIETRPARLVVPYLDAQPIGAYCEFTDATAPSPRRVPLLKKRASYDFPPASGSR